MLDALSAATLDEVLRAFVGIAETLADLAAEGIHHRDLKPSNLFLLDGRWVIGDFGLATYPDKSSVTTDERKLGPVYYIAPEMLNAPSTVHPAPADVFSIAKSIWVLATQNGTIGSGLYNCINVRKIRPVFLSGDTGQTARKRGRHP